MNIDGLLATFCDMRSAELVCHIQFRCNVIRKETKEEWTYYHRQNTKKEPQVETSMVLKTTHCLQFYSSTRQIVLYLCYKVINNYIIGIQIIHLGLLMTDNKCNQHCNMLRMFPKVKLLNGQSYATYSIYLKRQFWRVFTHTIYRELRNIYFSSHSSYWRFTAATLAQKTQDPPFTQRSFEKVLALSRYPNVSNNSLRCQTCYGYF